MKRNIDLNNYEAYFLDYHEGSLSPVLAEELMEFIAKHPELREEFESFQPIILNDSEAIIYNEKETLKKQLAGINSSNFDEYAIEHVEGNLSPSIKKEFSTFISQNPKYKKEVELYAKTKLTPDKSIVFEDKLSLKRSRKKSVVYYYLAAAASVAVIIGTYFFVNNNETHIGNTIGKHAPINDSSAVVKVIVKPTDKNSVTPKNTSIAPINNMVKSSAIVITTPHKKQDSTIVNTPVKVNNDSSAIAINKGVNKKQNVIETFMAVPNGNDSLVSNADIPDTLSISEPLIKYSNSDVQNISVIAEPKKKKGKFLILLATLTCKGLHKITGQHIEIVKKFDADTTNIIAYQLDLGNKKINFPVKD